MSEKAKPSRDVHAFSLRGLSTINSFGVVPAVGDDRINQKLDQHMKRRQDDQPHSGNVDPEPRRGTGLRLRLRRRPA